MLLTPRHSSLGWMARRVIKEQLYGHPNFMELPKCIGRETNLSPTLFLIFHPFFLNGGEVGPEYLPQSSVSGLFN